MLSYTEFFKQYKRIPVQIFSIVGIDEVSKISQLEHIVEANQLQYYGVMVVSSSLSLSEIPNELLSNFEIKMLS